MRKLQNFDSGLASDCRKFRICLPKYPESSDKLKSTTGRLRGCCTYMSLRE